MKKLITLFALGAAIGMFLNSGLLIESIQANSLSKFSKKPFDFTKPSRRNSSIIASGEDPYRSELTRSGSSFDLTTPSPWRGLIRTPSEDRYQSETSDRYSQVEGSIPFALSKNLDPLRNGDEINSRFSPYSENGQFSLDRLPGLGPFNPPTYVFSTLAIAGLVTLLALAQ